MRLAYFQDDGEEDSSIIEERDSRLSMGTRDSREDRDSPPRCQGCHERSAQFVCAGCGNQWYCSRECQVNIVQANKIKENYLYLKKMQIIHRLYYSRVEYV